MNPTTNTTPISDFILQSERNLRIAEAIFSTEWTKARETLVKRFCARLGEELTKKLIGWKFEYWGLLADRWGKFVLWKPGWEDQYYVTIEANDYGNRMIGGILRMEEKLEERPFSSELLEAVRQRFPSARSRKWYEAEITLHSPAADWRTPEILWQMHTQDGFLQEVAAQLLELVVLSEKLFDSLVANHRHKQ